MSPSTRLPIPDEWLSRFTLDSVFVIRAQNGGRDS